MPIAHAREYPTVHYFGNLIPAYYVNISIIELFGIPIQCKVGLLLSSSVNNVSTYRTIPDHIDKCSLPRDSDTCRVYMDSVLHSNF